MKLLILTQYFPPETGAPQNRLFELALRLQKLGMEITVLTAMPNYPRMEIFEGYRGKTYHYEEVQGLKVHRSSIFVSKNKSIINRLRNYFSFVLSSRRAGKKIPGNFDFLLCESPPLFLGYTAMYLARTKKAKLIFNVSDLWPESAEKLGVVTNSFLLSKAYELEATLYKRSALVTGQTQGICRSINERFPTVKTYWLPNGVDLDYYDPDKISEGEWRKKNGFSDTDIIFMYAGIIGIAQGLEVILNAAKHFTDRAEIKFVLLGNGPEKEKLLALKVKSKLNNVFFFDSVGKKEMPSIVEATDAAIIPLRKLDLFKGAIPSKIFENLAMRVPVILGVDGEARELFVAKGECGIYYEPENEEHLVQAVKTLADDKKLREKLGSNGRNFAYEHFNRNKIAEAFFQKLKELHVA